jgi:outer membrane protein assembly factor BamE (lipoprotein component of BamABCDE complex)
VPSIDLSITRKTCEQRTNNAQEAPARFASSLGLSLKMTSLGALLSLLGACSSIKDLNPLPESWRGGNSEKAAQSPDIGARSRLQSIFSPYRTTVQQGNYITNDLLEQIRSGMTRNQVQFVLGQPLLSNSFRDDRWIYVFRMQWPDLTPVGSPSFLMSNKGLLASNPMPCLPVMMAKTLPYLVIARQGATIVSNFREHVEP